jgi:hypothetical protein
MLSSLSVLFVVFREARRTNSVLKAEHMADTIVPLLKLDGTVSDAFPKNLSALFAIDRKWGRWGAISLNLNHIR